MSEPGVPVDVGETDWREHRGQAGGFGNIFHLGHCVGLMCLYVYQSSSDFIHMICSLYINFILIKKYKMNALPMWVKLGKPNESNLILFLWLFKIFKIYHLLKSLHHLLCTSFQFQVVNYDIFPQVVSVLGGRRKERTISVLINILINILDFSSYKYFNKYFSSYKYLYLIRTKKNCKLWFTFSSVYSK